MKKNILDWLEFKNGIALFRFRFPISLNDPDILTTFDVHICGQRVIIKNISFSEFVAFCDLFLDLICNEVEV